MQRHVPLGCINAARKEWIARPMPLPDRDRALIASGLKQQEAIERAGAILQRGKAALRATSINAL